MSKLNGKPTQKLKNNKKSLKF